jgi:hypothetical protein
MTQRHVEPLRIRASVIEAHRVRGADPADIQRAYLRFSWARRKAPRPMPVVRWVLAGVAVGFGVASAATLIQPPKAAAPAPSESAKAVAATAKHRHGGFGARSTTVEQAPTAVAPIAAPSERPPSSTRPSSSTWRAEPHAGTLPSASLPSASKWQRAAEALRDGDLPTAEQALAELENSQSLHDRQAAELARAQLLVRGGRAAEAIPTLQRLARNGDSPVIRAQAATLLDSFNR